MAIGRIRVTVGICKNAICHCQPGFFGTACELGHNRTCPNQVPARLADCVDGESRCDPILLVLNLLARWLFRHFPLVLFVVPPTRPHILTSAAAMAYATSPAANAFVRFALGKVLVRTCCHDHRSVLAHRSLVQLCILYSPDTPGKDAPCLCASSAALVTVNALTTLANAKRILLEPAVRPGASNLVCFTPECMTRLFLMQRVSKRLYWKRYVCRRQMLLPNQLDWNCLRRQSLPRAMLCKCTMKHICKLVNSGIRVSVLCWHACVHVYSLSLYIYRTTARAMTESATVSRTGEGSIAGLLSSSCLHLPLFSPINCADCFSSLIPSQIANRWASTLVIKSKYPSEAARTLA